MNRIKLITVILVFSILSGVSFSNLAEPRPGEQIAICHKGFVIYVNANAVAKHMAHGDFEPIFLSRDACSVVEPVLTPL